MNQTRMRLSAVLLDTTIQCRASIDPEVVSQYAADMTEGAVFPPVVLYGTADCAYPGDGWHRIMAAQQVGYKEIDADLRPGGIKDALRHALGANRDHGLRRTNADKRRAVEIAAREFPDLSDNAIAELCGVDNHTVAAHRPTLGSSQPAKRTGADGKAYPAKRAPKPEADDPDDIAGFRESDGTAPSGTEPVDDGPAAFVDAEAGARTAALEIAGEIKRMCIDAVALKVANADKPTVREAFRKAGEAVRQVAKAFAQ